MAHLPPVSGGCGCEESGWQVSPGAETTAMSRSSARVLGELQNIELCLDASFVQKFTNKNPPRGRVGFAQIKMFISFSLMAPERLDRYWSAAGSEPLSVGVTPFRLQCVNENPTANRLHHHRCTSRLCRLCRRKDQRSGCGPPPCQTCTHNAPEPG